MWVCAWESKKIADGVRGKEEGEEGSEGVGKK
jgi:hypothetical protein